MYFRMKFAEKHVTEAYCSAGNRMFKGKNLSKTLFCTGAP